MIKFLTKHSRVLFLGAFASLAVSFNACTDIDNTLGDDFIDPSMKGSVLIDSSFVIDSYTVSTDRFPTSLTGRYYLGTYNDPVFGQVQSSLVSLLTPVRIDLYADTVHKVKNIESIELTLKLKGGVGDSLAKQKLSVFQLKDTLKLSSVFYSDYKIESNKGVQISESEVEYNRQSNNVVTIKLNTSFAESMIKWQTIKKFYDSTKVNPKVTMLKLFVDAFKGVYVKNTGALAGVGGLNAIDFADTSTRVLIRYKVLRKSEMDKVGAIPDSTVRLKINLGSRDNNNNVGHVFNVVDHEYNGTSPYKPVSINPDFSNTANPPTSQDLVYIQGFGGLRTMVKFSNPASLAKFENKGYKIHRAELVVEPYFPNGELNYKKMPSAISAYYPSATKKDTMVVVPDMSIFKGISTNAFYNRSRRLYSLNITTYFKDVMRDPSKPKFVYLYAGVPATVYNSQNGGYNPFELAGEFLSSPTQVILGKPGKPNHVKLIITYSK